MIKELERIYLVADLAGTSFIKGDVGTVVFIYPENKAYEVEFLPWTVQALVWKPPPPIRLNPQTE